MSSEIDMVLSPDVKEDIELSSTENLFRIRKYLLILVTIQWVGSYTFLFKNKNIHIGWMSYWSSC